MRMDGHRRRKRNGARKRKGSDIKSLYFTTIIFMIAKWHQCSVLVVTVVLLGTGSALPSMPTLKDRKNIS